MIINKRPWVVMISPLNQGTLTWLYVVGRIPIGKSMALKTGLVMQSAVLSHKAVSAHHPGVAGTYTLYAKKKPHF